MEWLFGLLIVLIIGVVAYWQLIIAEGAYLGAPLVALLYDWTAERYNGIKEFNEAEEDFILGVPLGSRLHRQPGVVVLDVATGTGRIPLLLMRLPAFQGKVVGVDRASKMLAVAKRDTADAEDRVILVQADAMALPFASDSIPLVTCLEALEFLPNPRSGLRELVRVLQPRSNKQPSRGWLLTTQRIGWETKLLPGKVWSRQQLLDILQALPLSEIRIQIWQDIYNLVWAQKTGSGKNPTHNA